jgi:hypothetical protein
MRRGEMVGAAIHEMDEIRDNATKFVSITHLRNRKGGQNWGGKSQIGRDLTCLHEV